MRIRKNKVSLIKLRRNRVCHHFPRVVDLILASVSFTKHGQLSPRLSPTLTLRIVFFQPFSDVVGKPHLEIFSNPVGLSFLPPHLFARQLAKFDFFATWMQ